jgi:3-hydroxyisobutyrate dehydrogenase-like beta-hydroxyacid dehydrogenase
MTLITPDRCKLGFIGLGSMGRPIVQRLLESGYKVMVYNRDRRKAEALVEHGATVAKKISQLAFHADVILSCLANDDAVRSIYMGSEGVFANARPGSLIIEMSTVRPETSRELYKKGSDLNVSVLDVPISGSTPAAEQGTLTLLGGGDEEVFKSAEPLFRAIARQYFYLGPSGSGTTMKLVVNALLGVGMQAIAEAVALGQKAGLHRERLFDVLSHTAVIAPAYIGKLTRAASNDYSPQFAMRLMNKDFRLILERAAEMRVPVPVTAAAFQINTAKAADYSDEDFSAVIRRMENLARLDSHDEGHRSGALSQFEEPVLSGVEGTPRPQG